jgi:hypothetical protein
MSIRMGAWFRSVAPPAEAPAGDLTVLRLRHAGKPQQLLAAAAKIAPKQHFTFG